MKLRIKKGSAEIELEGDAHELSTALRVLEPELDRLFGEPDKGSNTPPESPPVAMTAEDAYAIFTRRKLSDAQYDCLNAIYLSDEKGILASEIISRSDSIPSKPVLAGVLGGLGRRVSHSFANRSYPFSLFDDILEWVDEGGEYRYTMTEPAREAMARIELLG